MAVRTSKQVDVKRRDRARVGREHAGEEPEIVAANGSRVRDARGRTFIDFQMGWNVGALGWNPPEVVGRVRRFNGPMYVAPGFLYEPWAALAEQLVEVAPGKLARAYRCVSGTEAVEQALQLAMTHTGRSKVVSIEGAYHGNSFAARSVGDGGDLPHLPGCKKLAPPLDARALDRLETLLKHKDVAAFLFEPVITNLDVTIPDGELIRGVVALCHRYGTLVIADEVATGFGRCGVMFASELHGLEPDLMCLGKALGGGVVPIAATLATADVARSAEGELSFYSTFGWQPLGVEAALAMLAYWRRNRDALLENVAARSAEVRDRLARMPFRGEPEVRIQGLAIAVALDDEEYVARIDKQCRRSGLLLYAEEDTLMMMPAIDIDAATLREGLDVLESSCR